MHRGLQRQLRKLWGVADEDGLRRLFDEAAGAAGGSQHSEGVRAVLATLPQLIERIGLSYEQYERDLELRSRSLALSSDELTRLNDALRTQLQSRDRGILSLRQLVDSLLGTDSEGGDGHDGAADGGDGEADTGRVERDDIAALADLLGRLIEQRETARHELVQQRFALDQHAIVSITDVHGTITYVNDRFCETSGYAREELIGRNHRLIGSGMHSPELFAELWRTVHAGHVWRGRICNRDRDGALHWFDTTIVPFVDASGVPDRFIAIRNDVTELRRTTEQLRDNLELVDALIESTTTPVFLKDAAGRYTRVNGAFLRQFGLRDADEVLGLTFEEWMPGDASVPHMNADRALFASGRPQSYEAHVPLPQGAQGVDVLVHKAPLVKADGTAIGVVGTLVDVTARKQQEDALRRARDAAESAARAKTSFLAMMSHELRTPMTGIIGMSDLLADTVLDGEQQRLVDVLRNSAHSLLTVLNDVLDISKIEAGKLSLEEIDFAPPAVAAEVVALLASAASGKGNNLVADWDAAALPTVRGDPTRFRQVLFNLVGNAIKFTERGNVTIRLRAIPGDGQRMLMRCEVADTGVGIPADVLPLLFQPFQQADSTTTRRFGGTGLGLAICRHLVKAMRGDIGVDSRPGVGSTFWFTVELPLARSALADAAAAPAPAAARAGGPRSLRILLAEDNETNQLLIATRLRKSGHKVQIAGNGRIAVDAFRAGSFDLVLMDMQMPELDGPGATREIRALGGSGATVPIIALTADALPEFRARYMASGLTEYLTKPIDWKALYALIERCLPPDAPPAAPAPAIGTSASPAAAVSAAGSASSATSISSAAPVSSATPVSHATPVSPATAAPSAVAPIPAVPAAAPPLATVARSDAPGVTLAVARPSAIVRAASHPVRREPAEPIAGSLDVCAADEVAEEGRAVAAARAQFGDDVYEAAVSMFWATSASECARIEAAVRTGDAAARRGAAHAMRGAALTVGLNGVAKAASALERADQTGSPALLAELLAALARARSRAGIADAAATWHPSAREADRQVQ